MSDLIAHLSIKKGILVAKALDGYAIDIPLIDAVAARAFIVVTRNGQPMPIRKKGPYWIIFPWSDGVDTTNKLLSSWSIWQLVEFTIKEGN